MAQNSVKSNLDSPENGLTASETKQKCFLSVQGMTCSSCVAAIENRLGKMAGIDSVQVALLASKAEIVYDPRRWTPAQIADLLEDMGFEATVLDTIDSSKYNELTLHVEQLKQVESTICQVLHSMIGVETVQVTSMPQSLVRLNFKLLTCSFNVILSRSPSNIFLICLALEPLWTS